MRPIDGFLSIDEQFHRNMKIDFLITKMSDGGAQRVVSLLANYLADRDHEVRIITFRDGDHYPLHEKVKRIKMHQKPLIDSVVFSGFFSLLSFYRKKSNRPDVMSSHIDLLGYMTIPIARIFNIKIIVSEHNNHLSRYTYQERFLWKFLYPMASAVTVLTQFDLPYFQKKNRRTVVMPNPYSFQVASRVSLSDERKKEVMAIGNLNRVHHKGFDNLMDIVKEISSMHPEWKFVIVGAGNGGRPQLEARIKELGISDYVTLMGFRKDIKELLSRTGIYILPSRFEGLPMTLLEAMSQGVPCIAYDCISGPGDIIRDGETGLLIENQNMDEMIKGLSQLIQSPELRDKFSQNAPGSLEKYSIEKVGAKWENLIEQIT